MSLKGEIAAMWLRLVEGHPADATEMADALLSPEDKLTAFKERYEDDEFIFTTYSAWQEVFAPYLDERTGDPILTRIPPSPSNNLRAWTLCESDGKQYISPGIRNVDVLGYYRCRYPWPHQNIQVDIEE